MKRVIITGATGLIGKNLCLELLKSNYNVIALTRNPSTKVKFFSKEIEVVEWDYKSKEHIIKHLENAFSIIHLAGAGIFNHRWNNKFKNEIYNSRVISTKILVDAISSLNKKPESFISSSAVGYYGNRGDEFLSENSIPGKDFLSKVCIDWESEASKSQNFGVRWVSIRTGIVLSTQGGALKKMLPIFKYFLGGALGSGKQWFSWIHIDDIIGIYKFTLENPNCQGALNASSPHLVTMKEFVSKLGKVLNRPSIFSVPEFILKIVLGESAKDITSSQRVLSEKILNYGYKFKYENLDIALEDLVKNNK